MKKAYVIIGANYGGEGKGVISRFVKKREPLSVVLETKGGLLLNYEEASVKSAIPLIRLYGAFDEIEVIYVTRAYVTRIDEGVLPHEIDAPFDIDEPGDVRFAPINLKDIYERTTADFQNIVEWKNREGRHETLRKERAVTRMDHIEKIGHSIYVGREGITIDSTIEFKDIMYDWAKYLGFGPSENLVRKR
jgi:hypothetical protein